MKASELLLLDAEHKIGDIHSASLERLFKRDTINDKNTELLIFITPRIVKEP